MLKRTLPAVALAFSMIASAHAAKLPRPAAPFTINMPDGKEVALSSYKGKVVALGFILTTCPHCQEYVRLLNKMHYEFAPQGLQVVVSAVDEKARPALPNFIRAYAPPYPVGYNDVLAVSDFIENPRTLVMHMPIIVFLDRQGNVMGQYQATEPFIEQDPEQNLRSTIQGLLRGTITQETVRKEEAARKAAAAKSAPKPVAGSGKSLPAESAPAKSAPAKTTPKK